jgi:hypothetical protein
MKKRVSVCIRHLADGKVSVEIIDEEGKVMHRKIFGSFSQEEYALLLKAIDRDASAGGALSTTISPSHN